MARYVIPSWDLPAVPVSGTDALFPVRRIHGGDPAPSLRPRHFVKGAPSAPPRRHA